MVISGWSYIERGKFVFRIYFFLVNGIFKFRFFRNLKELSGGKKRKKREKVYILLSINLFGFF